MAKRDSFQGTYEIEDGYAGGARPHAFEVFADDLDDDMTDEEIAALYDQEAQTTFQDEMSIYTTGGDAFLVWAREQLDARKTREERDGKD